MTVKVYQGKRADWVGLLSIICIDDKQSHIQYLGLTNSDHGHYPMVALYSMPSQDFYKWFKVTADPVAIFAKIYSEHARVKGITSEAAALLEKFTPNDEWNIDNMGKPKKEEAAPAVETKKPATKAAKPAATPKATEKAAPVAKEPVERKERHSVSGVIRSLILANATAKKPLTDDEIFTKAQESFPELDESKRNYVPWVRSQLKRQGAENVPEAVGGPKPRGPKPKEAEAPAAAPEAAPKAAKGKKAEAPAAPTPAAKKGATKKAA